MKKDRKWVKLEGRHVSAVNIGTAIHIK